MPDPKTGASVIYATAKGDPDQHAVITAVGVDDDEAETSLTDCWLTVFPAGAAPYALQQPAAYDPSGKAGTWRWDGDSAPAKAPRKTAAPKQAPADDKGADA